MVGTDVTVWFGLWSFVACNDQCARSAGGLGGAGTGAAPWRRAGGAGQECEFHGTGAEQAAVGRTELSQTSNALSSERGGEWRTGALGRGISARMRRERYGGRGGGTLCRTERIAGGMCMHTLPAARMLCFVLLRLRASVVAVPLELHLCAHAFEEHCRFRWVQKRCLAGQGCGLLRRCCWTQLNKSRGWTGKQASPLLTSPLAN